MKLPNHDVAFFAVRSHRRRRSTIIVHTREDCDLVLPRLYFESSILVGICSQWLGPSKTVRGRRTLFQVLLTLNRDSLLIRINEYAWTWSSFLIPQKLVPEWLGFLIRDVRNARRVAHDIGRYTMYKLESNSR